MKLVAIFGSPAPYTTPVLNALPKQFDLHSIYLTGEDRVSRFRDSWGVAPEFDHSVHWAKSLDVPSVDLHVELTAGVARRLSRIDPDAVLLVSWKPAVLEPLLWSRWSGAAAVMWAESTPFSGLLRGVTFSRARRVLAGAFDGYVANGSQATRYLLELGVPPNRIVTSALPAAKAPETTARAVPRREDGLDFLFVGRLIPQKRPIELIEAFGTVREELAGATLTLVGGGELAPEVAELAAGIPGVRYLGHREGEELASVYAASDILVLPALREVWGLVVNEALGHGLFVVTTDQVGSAYDLLDAGSGLVLPAEDPGRLAPTLVDVARAVDTSDAARRHRASAVVGCTPERFAEDIARAVEIALRVRATRWRAPRTFRP